METIDLIQNSLYYIEGNLKTEIFREELAFHAGYSMYPYCWIFTVCVGYPVAAYITKSRLLMLYSICTKEKEHLILH